jgi:predicted molibdopterin-dependent oxidoreductase YjgC
MRRAIDTRGTRLIIVNPKRIDMCDRATLFLQNRPGTDVAVFNGMARAILDAGVDDRAFIRARTEGFDGWLEAVREPRWRSAPRYQASMRTSWAGRVAVREAAPWRCRPER